MTRRLARAEGIPRIQKFVLTVEIEYEDCEELMTQESVKDDLSIDSSAPAFIFSSRILHVCDTTATLTSAANRKTARAEGKD